MTITPLERLHRRQKLIRKKIKGTIEQPRLSVYRSLKHIYAQAIDDTTGKTILSTSTLSPEIRNKLKGKTKTEQARLVGELTGKKLLEKNIGRIVFDRRGRKYHGRIKALADGIRSQGVNF